jgi:dolichyl-phosphate-mannose-protein mannosyltransferase
MPLPDSRYLQQPSSPQVTLDFGTPPSPTSSFEEVSYPSSWGQHHPHHHQHSLEEEALPLHNMEPRRRNVAHTEKSGWISPTSPAGRPRSPGAAYLDQDDSNMKGAHAKIKSPFNPGLPPPTRQRRVPPPENFVRSFYLSLISLPHAILFRPVQWDFVWQNTEHIPPLIYTLLSCFTRFYKIGLSDVVVWDEVSENLRSDVALQSDLEPCPHRPILENSVLIILNASFISTFTLLLAKCSSD